MIHYTCDRCKREINMADQVRYVVQLEVRAVADDSFSEFTDEVDHLSELNELLETHGIDHDASGPGNHSGRYDLCPACHGQFLKNPLGREASFALNFSDN